MKNSKQIGSLLLVLACSLTVGSWGPDGGCQKAMARGGGGGRGFGGGFGGGYGGRGGDFGGMRSDGGMDRGYVGDHDGDGDSNRGYVGDRDSDADHNSDGWGSAGVKNYARTQAYEGRYDAHNEGLSTDGGFGRLSAEYGGTALGRGYGSTRPWTQAGLLNHGDDVRGAWNGRNHPAFDRVWLNNHRDWWGYAGWGDGWWGGCGWGNIYPYWDMSEAAAPVEYDYGNNITYQGDQVYYGTQAMATSDQYYDQAQQLAVSAPVVPTTLVNGMTQFSGDWKPLGVYSLTDGGDSNSNTIFQLAVNKAGVISGNYYNTLNNQSSPIKGRVDKKTMRVAFTVGKNKAVVYDTGLANLFEPQSPILVHTSKSKTQQEVLVKLQDPKGGTATKAG